MPIWLQVFLTSSVPVALLTATVAIMAARYNHKLDVLSKRVVRYEDKSFEIVDSVWTGYHNAFWRLTELVAQTALLNSEELREWPKLREDILTAYTEASNLRREAAALLRTSERFVPRFLVEELWQLDDQMAVASHKFGDATTRYTVDGIQLVEVPYSPEKVAQASQAYNDARETYHKLSERVRDHLTGEVSK